MASGSQLSGSQAKYINTALLPLRFIRPHIILGASSLQLTTPELLFLSHHQMAPRRSTARKASTTAGKRVSQR
jgi:hypothetical protein